MYVIFSIFYFSSEYANRSIGGLVHDIRVREVDGTVAHLPGTHWGNGVVLLDRDHNFLKSLLVDLFQTEFNPEETVGKSPFTHVYGHLLRAFCFGRSYVRLFAYGTYKGYRTHHVPFIRSRYNAIESEWSFKDNMLYQNLNSEDFILNL